MCFFQFCRYRTNFPQVLLRSNKVFGNISLVWAQFSHFWLSRFQILAHVTVFPKLFWNRTIFPNFSLRLDKRVFSHFQDWYTLFYPFFWNRTSSIKFFEIGQLNKNFENEAWNSLEQKFREQGRILPTHFPRNKYRLSSVSIILSDSRSSIAHCTLIIVLKQTEKMAGYPTGMSQKQFHCAGNKSSLSPKGTTRLCHWHKMRACEDGQGALKGALYRAAWDQGPGIWAAWQCAHRAGNKVHARCVAPGAQLRLWRGAWSRIRVLATRT